MAGRVPAPTLGPVEHQQFEIEETRRAPCPPEAVLDQILTPATWPEWQSEILRVEGPERLAPGDAVLGDARLLGFRVEGRSTSVEVSSDSFAHDVIVGVRMKVRYTVQPDGGGAQVTHHLETNLPGGVAGRLLSLFLTWRLRRMQTKLLDDLVTRCDEGIGAG